MIRETSAPSSGGSSNNNKLVINNDDELLSSKSGILMQRFLLEQSSTKGTSERNDSSSPNGGSPSQDDSVMSDESSIIFSPPGGRGGGGAKNVEMVVTLTLFDNDRNDTNSNDVPTRTGGHNNNSGHFFIDSSDDTGINDAVVSKTVSKDSSTDTTKADVEVEIYNTTSRGRDRHRRGQRRHQQYNESRDDMHIPPLEEKKSDDGSFPRLASPKARRSVALASSFPISPSSEESSIPTPPKSSFPFNRTNPSTNKSKIQTNHKNDNNRPMPSSSANIARPIAPVQLFALLFDPDTGVFELLQLSIYKHQPNSYDLLKKITSSVTEPSLKSKSPYRLITMDHAKDLLQETPLIHALDDNLGSNKDKKKKNGIHLVAIPTISSSTSDPGREDILNNSLEVNDSNDAGRSSSFSSDNTSTSDYHSPLKDRDDIRREYDDFEAYFFSADEDDSSIDVYTSNSGASSSGV